MIPFNNLVRELWSGGRGWILVSVSIGWSLSIGVRFIYPILVPFFQSEFQIGLSTVGLLLTMLWGAYALGHIPGGILGDRLGEGNILVVSTGASAVAVLVVTSAVNVWMLFAGTITFGVATALYGPTRFTILTNIYPEQSGSAIGLTMAAGNIGNTVFPPIAAFLATYLTWRFGIGVFFPFFLIILIALWWVVPERTSDPTSVVDEFSKDTLNRIVDGIRSDSIPIVVLIQISVSLIIQGFASFYPAYLVVSKGLSPGVAAILFGLFFAIGAIIQPISGTMGDRIGSKKTLTIFLGGCVLALWILPLSYGLITLVLVTVLFSSWNGCSVITQTYIANRLPTNMQGTGFGTLKASWMLVGSISPLLIGIFADYGYFDEAFQLLAFMGTVGLMISLFWLPDS